MKASVLASAIIFLSILIAGGCAEKSESLVSEQAPAASTQQAAARRYTRVDIDADAGEFWFEPSRCFIYEEDGAYSYSIQGPGQSPDGQLVFVTLDDEDGDSSTGADVRIHVGVDAPFKHGDPVWISNDRQSVSLRVAKSRTSIESEVLTSSGVVFGKDHGGQLAVNGSIRVDCSL